MKQYRVLKQSIVLSIIFCSIILSITTVSAVDKTYYWDRTNGVSIAGYTTDWSSCSSSSPQSGYRVTSLGSSASSCTNGQLTRTNAGDLFLTIFPTAYSSDTQITGMANARFYLRSNSGSATYRFDLGYARSGAFTSLGSVTRTGVSTTGTTYTIDLSSISGTAPAGSNLALKVSVTTSGGGRVYMGTNGGSSGSNSGRFYVNETVTSQTSTYNVTVTPSPTSANVAAGGSSVYTIRVNNTGNTNGNYNLVVSDSNSANFQTSTPGTSSLAVTAGGSNQTTLTVTAKAGATIGASDITTVTATSVQNSSYTGSAQVTTNVVGIIPAHTFDTRATDGTTTFATTPNPRTLSYTAGTGSTVMVLNIFTTTTTARAGGAPTFNGKTFTQVGTRQQTAGSTPEGAVEMWYLLLTPSDTGSAHTVSVPNTGSTAMRIHVSTYESTTGASALDVFAQRPNTGTSQANPSQSITTTANGDVLVDALFDGLSSVPSANSHTLLYKQLAASSYSANSQYYLQPTAGAQALSWTAAADDFALITASFKAVQTSSSYDVTVTPSPASANVAAGGSSVYTIRVNNTGNTNGNYNLAVSDSNSVNFQTSTPGTSSLAVTAGGSNQTTLTVTAKAGATTGAVDNTTVTVISVENSSYTSSANVQTTVTGTAPPSNDPKIIVKANRYVVLDDPNAGTKASGFFDPTDVRGGSYGTNYWSGESTTIRAAAIVMSSAGSKLPGVTITFNLINPAGGSPVHTATSITDGEGAAYYSYDLNSKNYWGNWKIDASATVSGNNVANSSSFILYWWGCGQCHGSESPGKWGSIYTPKSYYTMGYDFHKSQNKAKHTETMAKGNCVTCHQMYNGIPINRGYNDNTPPINVESEYTPDWHNGKVTCQECHAGSNISTNPQDKNPEIAGCYDTPGCHPNKNTNVNNENSTSGYVVGGTYKSLYSNIPNSSKAHTTTSVRCILCHDAGHDISKPYNVSSTSNNITENEQCWACHGQRNGTHFGPTCTGCHSQNAHKISVSGGGPDCISCHGLGGTASHKVDENAMAGGMHSNLNSEATASGVSAANKKCWGCHQSDGNQPTGMGNKYNNPYRCYECHGPTKPYTRVNGTMTVNEHFKGAADVKAGIFAVDDSASCALCHSVSEMTVSYTDNEFSELSIGSHYGKNKSGTLDCLYCHRNTSTVFMPAMMSNAGNNNLSNHSGNPSTPVCTTCHGSGMLHNATLTKPTSSNGTYCKTCHSNKKEHKTVNCAECHTNNSDRNNSGREIHGIRYLQKDNTFSTAKTNVVDCTTCHQSDAVNSSLLLAPPQISDPLHHSDDINNGSKWGSYWNSSINACLYCHNDTRHNATPLGRPLLWNPSYVLNTTIGSGTNCADCHYKGDTSYNSMKSAFTTVSKPIPPEITNGSWNGKSGYFNHSLGGYTDLQCQGCHYKGNGTTVGQMLHDVSVGGGGPDCKSCHDVGSVSAPALVNFSAMNNSAAGHKNLNSGATTNVNAENVKCWACHGDGTQPGGHPTGYTTPKDCTNCHTGSGSYSAPIVAEHQPAGQDVKTAVNCTQCHDNNGMYISGTGVGTVNHYVKDVTNTATTPYGHLGPIDTSICILCHNGPYTNDPAWGTPVNISTLPGRPHPETLTSQCDACHKDASVLTLANVDFHNAALKAGAGGANCLGCHANVE